ncbi:hypothetical protein [Clostridium sp. Marseille-Q7071]
MIGDENFKDSIKEFINEHKEKNIDFNMFKNFIEERTEINLSKFFDEWILE